MKKIVTTLLLIILTSILFFRILIRNSPQDPIEIIPKQQTKYNKDNENSDKTKPLSSDYEDQKNEIQEKSTKEGKINQEDQNKEINDDKKEKEIPIEIEVTEKQEADFIVNKKTNWGYTSSAERLIDTIVIHSSYDALGSEPYDLEGLIQEYKQYKVAPHFVIDRAGNVYRLVDEKNIAWHAGTSEMPDSRTGVNDFSIGIELINTKEDEYTKQQYSSLNDLIEFLENNHKIEYILGHNDIAPERKTDPWNFEWNKIDSKNSIH